VISSERVNRAMEILVGGYDSFLQVGLLDNTGLMGDGGIPGILALCPVEF